jgi:hypothetical protein
MKYIKPQIEYNEILSEDILTESNPWGDILAGGPNTSLGFEDGNPVVNGDASDFVG